MSDQQPGGTFRKGLDRSVYAIVAALMLPVAYVFLWAEDRTGDK